MKFPSLQHFILREIHGISESWPFANAASKIRRLPPTVLKITIAISWKYLGNLRASMFEKVDSSIVDGNFPNLKSVRFVFRHEGEPEPNPYLAQKGKEFLEARFQTLRCYKKGLVRLIFEA